MSEISDKAEEIIECSAAISLLEEDKTKEKKREIFDVLSDFMKKREEDSLKIFVQYYRIRKLGYSPEKTIATMKRFYDETNKLWFENATRKDINTAADYMYVTRSGRKVPGIIAYFGIRKIGYEPRSSMKIVIAPEQTRVKVRKGKV